jgi:hypothetical protein
MVGIVQTVWLICTGWTTDKSCFYSWQGLDILQLFTACRPVGLSQESTNLVTQIALSGIRAAEA